MKRRVILALAFISLLTSCVPDPSDPIGFGTLCQPAVEDCPASVLLERDVVGRNQVDWVVRNEGASAVSFDVVAVVPQDAPDAGLDELTPEALIAMREYAGLGAGEEVDDRFTPQDLGVRESFVLALRCTGCEVELDWVQSTVPRECYENDECVANWQCDQNLGRCVECLTNADCNEGQICDVQRGRCDPPDTTAGCSTTSSPTPRLPGSLVVVLIALVGARRRRIAAAALVAVSSLAVPASASPPRAAISVGTGPRLLTGPLGEDARRGIGFGIGQELRWRYVGAGIALGTSYFLTRQQGPPLSRQLQTYSVTIGPRAYLPIRWFEVTLGADYRRVGLVNNSLVRRTGTRLSFDAVGGSGGFRLRWEGLEVRLEGGFHTLLQNRSSMLSVDLSIGFTNPT